MARLVFVIFLLLASGWVCRAQSSFVMGNDKVSVGFITHQYLFDLAYKDSFKTTLVDSVLVLASRDSLIIQEQNHPIGDPQVLSTVTILNKMKKPLKVLVYKGNALQISKEWTYNGNSAHPDQYIEDNKAKGMVRREVYSSTYDKINGDLIIEVTAYIGEKVEFYSREYYDKSNRKYKEVRLNDNKKDVLHTENYTYNEAGKLVSRSVYFKEFNVTKTYKEPESVEAGKCFKNFPLVLSDRVTQVNRAQFIRGFLQKNQTVILDKDCREFEYFFKSFNCEVQVKSNKNAGSRQLKVTVSERI